MDHTIRAFWPPRGLFRVIRSDARRPGFLRFVSPHRTGLFLWLAAVLGLSAADPPRALAQRFWPEPLDTVRVSARRPQHPEPRSRATGSTSVIPLGDAAPAGRDLGDLLNRTVGVHVHRYGGLGAYSLASVRGSAPGQVLVCLDGTPVSTTGDGLVNLALLPVSSLERAEIHRGAQTRFFGGPPASGVINLVTPAAGAAPLRLSLGGGSFHTWTARGQAGAARGPWAAFLSGQFRRSRGDFPYLDRNGTYFGNTSDDRVVRRANNDFRDSALLWKGAWRSDPGLRAAYTGQVFARESGVPGTENVQTHSVRFSNQRVRHDLNLLARTEAASDDSAGAADAFSLELAGHEERLRERFENREGEVGLLPAAVDRHGRDRGGRCSAGAALPLAQAPRITVDLREERLRSTDLLRGAAEPERRRVTRGLSLEDRASLGPFDLNGAYTWVRARDNFAAGEGAPGGVSLDSPSAAAILRSEGAVFGLRWNLSPRLSASLNRGPAARFPSFPELFGQNGVQEGNPALRPERGVQWDAGVLYTPEAPLRFQCAWYESHLRDRIILVQNSQRTTKAMNLDRVLSRGLETSAYGRLSPRPGWGVEEQIDLTFCRAVDLGRSPSYHGKRVPNQPAFEGYLSTSVEHRGTRVGYELALRSSHYRDRYNTPSKRAPGSAVHDVSVERTWRGGEWSVRATVRNLADSRIEDMEGFPLPGRTAALEVTWTR